MTVSLSRLRGAARLSDAGSGSALDRWQMDKLFERDIVFRTGDDAAVRLVTSDADSIRTLVLKVASPERAETFLRESGMLGSVGEDHIKIDPSKIEGLDVRLVR